MRVIVIGAGIGGLTTALALDQVGIDDVTVVESVREIRPLGVGINLLPHAVRELDALGLADALAAAAVETADLTYYDRFGSRIWSEPRGLAAEYRWPQYSIHRGRLQMLLLEAVRRRLGAGRVVCSARVESATSSADGATVRYVRDGTVESVDADLVIAADGIRSAVRAQRFPDEGPPRWNGSVLWRGVSRAQPFLTGRSMIMAGNRDQKFVAYPIEAPAADGTQLINWIAERLSPDSDALNQDWSRRVDASVFDHYFEAWAFEWLDVPALIASAHDIFEYPMVDRAPLDAWNDGRVTLLGDAAHATYPIGSNGSSQAIIDARVLAFALATRPVDAALEFYEQERLPRTRELQRVNREMGPERVMQLTHERAPEGFVDIDDVVPHAERVEIAAAYKRVAGFDPAVLNELPSWSPDPVARA